MVRQSGALVIVDVTSGAVLAEHRLDLAARTLARPGSTLKPFVLMELLESHWIDANRKLMCRRVLRIGPVQMDRTHPASITESNTADAIAYSFNSYVAEVPLQLKDAELVQLLRRAGFDSRSGLASDEAIGHIDRPRNPEELQLEALGSRGIEVTPLELPEAYRKLAKEQRSGNLGSALHWNTVNPRIAAAVDTTQGEILWFGDTPAETYYHQSCGGTVAAGKEIWPTVDALPWIRD